MNVNDLVVRIDQLIQQGEEVRRTYRSDGSGWGWVDTGAMKGFRSAALSFIERVYGKDHSHYLEFHKAADGTDKHDAEVGIAILTSIKREISGGWLFSLKGLISAEIFSDFIEMAQHLLSQNYKDPAAVIAGSVLEEHLRQLAISNGVEIEVETDGVLRPKKADRLNSDLAKAEVYSKLDQKAVTMWLDLRNKAAHGHFQEYTKDQVSNMIQSVIEFMVRVSP
ncbi:hypothetical protein [Trichlorobacter lovleyi]|uniref:hypothetical protein n=2 Tax=Trichlorobacter lovleyi TaxID=313985 RepID=UPI003D0DF50C